MATIYSFETKKRVNAENLLEILKTLPFKENEYRLLVEMSERLKNEKIKFSITIGYFGPIIFAKFSELGNGSLRFAITAKKGRYYLDGYYDYDENLGQGPLMHLVEKKRLVGQTVINQIKHVTENFDEIVSAYKDLKFKNKS